VKQLGSTDLKRLHRDWRRRTPDRLGVVLDRLAQPFNVGAILRTAAAMRVDDVWFVADTPTPETSKVGKTALGADRYLTTHVVESDGAADVCLVVGHEDRGLSPTTLDACDAVGFVPQLGKIGSLNVATAAAIALYEARRQHWHD